MSFLRKALLHRSLRLYLGLFFVFFSPFALAEHERDQARQSAPRPRDEVSSNGLVPSGVNGNPGFTYSVLPPNGYGPAPLCQGTLVSAKDGVCTVATAAHCLEDDIPKATKKGRAKALNKPECKPELRDEVVSWGELKIQTADFGTVKAIGMIHPKASQGSKTHDTAVYYFNCPEGPGNVPVVKVDPSPLKAGEEFRYGKVMKRRGLFKGRVFGKRLRAVNSSQGVVLDIKEGNERDIIDQDSETAITQGDSGGPGLAYRDNEWKLVSVLTGYFTPVGPTKAIYQSGESMDFVACLAGDSEKSPNGSDKEQQRPSGSPDSMAGTTKKDKPATVMSPGQNVPPLENTTPPRQNPVFNGIEFSANDQNALESRPEKSQEANTPLFLLKKEGVRRAAYRNPDGTHTVAPENIQKGLKQYYEAHPEEVSRLPERQQRYVQEFLSGAKQSVAQLSPQETQPAQGSNHQAQETPKKEELSDKKADANENNNTDFECASTPQGFFPRKKGGQSKLLGTSGYPKRELCEQAVQNSRNGLICSYTGIGWKPTHFSGATEWERKVGREPHGYIGGSSIEKFSDCLKATSQSTPEGVCYWDGTSAWRVHDSQGLGNVPKGINPRGFQTIDQCVLALHKGQKAPSDQLQAEVGEQEPKEQKKETPKKEADKKEHEKEPSSFAKTHSLYGQHCASCHRPGDPGGIIPSWATDTSELEKRLSSSDSATQSEAKKWVEKLHKVLVDQDSMPPNDESREKMARDPEVAALKRFLQEHAPKSASAAVAANAVQLIEDPQKLAAYRKVLAGTKVKDSEVQAILTDPNTLIIDQKNMPSAYQDTSLPVEGARPSGHGTFVDGAPFLDGDNKLKMFGHGAGLSNDTKTFHLLSLPKDSKGNLQPIDYYIGKDSRDGGSRFGWKLPEGTTSLEVVTATDSKGKTYIQEIRKRKHDGNPQGAEVDIFTATPSKSDLQKRLTLAAKERPDLAEEVERVQSGLKQAAVTPVEIPNAYRVALGSKGATVQIPEMSEDLVKEVLGQGLASSKGVWDTKGQLQAYAPTTQQNFGIVPQGSQRGAIPVTRQSCNSCHALGDTRIRDLYQYDHLPGGSFKSLLDKTTFLYGSTPGNSNSDQRDGSNLRFHLFEGSLLPSFGNDQKGDNRRINPKLAPILRRVPAPRR